MVKNVTVYKAEEIDANEPLIGFSTICNDLSDETSLSLFRNNDRTIKKAALSGGIRLSSSFYWYERHEVLDEILNSFDEELLEPLLSNESIAMQCL